MEENALGTASHSRLVIRRAPKPKPTSSRRPSAWAAIPGVEAFELLAEVSPKNDYRFAISMEFADRSAYELYNDHPDHVRFVQDRWMPEVTDFLELDYAAR